MAAQEQKRSHRHVALVLIELKLLAKREEQEHHSEE
jgi:hypothetical protein